MLKTFTFAILHFGVAFAVTYALTGNIGISGAVALIEPTVNTVMFYIHEKVWQRYQHRQQPTERNPERSLRPCVEQYGESA